jgi:hypothetical protein
VLSKIFNIDPSQEKKSGGGRGLLGMIPAANTVFETKTPSRRRCNGAIVSNVTLLSSQRAPLCHLYKEVQTMEKQVNPIRPFVIFPLVQIKPASSDA